MIVQCCTGLRVLLGAFNPDNLDEQVTIPDQEQNLEFNDNHELNSKLKQFSSLCEESYFKVYSYDDLWRTTLDPKNLSSFDMIL